MVEQRKTPEDIRKTELAAIHIAKKELGLDDENYRFTLRAVCGVESASALDFIGRQKILMHFRALGWNPGAPGAKTSGRNGKPVKREKPTGQASKIWALWFELHRQGAVENKSIHALNAFVKRTTKGECDRLEWLTAEQANAVIEAQKQWLRRLE